MQLLSDNLIFVLVHILSQARPSKRDWGHVAPKPMWESGDRMTAVVAPANDFTFIFISLKEINQ